MQAYADRAALNETLQTRYSSAHCTFAAVIGCRPTEINVMLAGLQLFTAGHVKVAGAKVKYLGISSGCSMYIWTVTGIRSFTKASQLDQLVTRYSAAHCLVLLVALHIFAAWMRHKCTAHMTLKHGWRRMYFKPSSQDRHTTSNSSVRAALSLASPLFCTHHLRHILNKLLTEH